MSDPKQNLDPGSLDPSSLAYYAPPESPDRKDLSSPADRGPAPTDRRGSATPPQRRAEDATPHLRIVKPNETRVKVSTDAFAAAVAMAMRDQHETDLLDASAFLHRRPPVPAAAKFAIAVAAAALAALTYVLLWSPAQSPVEGQGSTLLRALIPASAPKVPTLVARNHSGTINEPLELGVSVEPIEPGATVAITGMPLGARLTAGEQMSLTEWTVPAADTASVLVIPPRDFVGDINPSAELRGPDGTSVGVSAVKLTWKAPMPGTAPANARQ